MKDKPKKTYTVMLIPDDNGRPLSLKISRALIRAIVVFCVVFIAGICVLLYRAGDIAVRLQLVSSLQKQNARLAEQNKKLLGVAAQIHSIERLTVYLRRLATMVNEQSGQGSTKQAAATTGERYFSDSVATALDDSHMGAFERYGDLSPTLAAPELLLGSIPNIRPVEGWITKLFSEKNEAEGESHLGVDFAASQGTLIRATSPGTVDEIRNDKYFGLLVTVKHSFGFETRYGHCSQVLVSQGDVVERGQTIALVGNTGQSSGPHLHYEVLRNGKHVDPIQYMLSHAVVP